jgi:dipeptide/tripeptide permease
MSILAKTFFGAILGSMFSLVILFCGLTAMGAGEGTMLPIALGIGVKGTGYFVWPIAGSMTAHVRKKIVRICLVTLLLVNYLGSIYFLVRSSSICLEIVGFNYLSVISLLIFVSVQIYVWFAIVSAHRESKHRNTKHPKHRCQALGT